MGGWAHVADLALKQLATKGEVGDAQRELPRLLDANEGKRTQTTLREPLCDLPRAVASRCGEVVRQAGKELGQQSQFSGTPCVLEQATKASALGLCALLGRALPTLRAMVRFAQGQW